MSLDFANPVGVAAMCAPRMRLVVFSDSVIITGPVDEVRILVSVLTFVSRQWFADGMLVRGGVACGDVEWVDLAVRRKLQLPQPGSAMPN